MAEDERIAEVAIADDIGSRSRPGGWTSLAWLPIPLLLAVIAALWVADPRTPYESRALMVLLNVCFTWLAGLCVCVLTARGFLASGRPGLLMFGCGSLLWGVTSLAAAAVVDRVNPTITVHNLGMLGAAVCHFVGLLWGGRLRRPGRWLLMGYAGVVLASALIFQAALAGWTPLFFVQGQGGTPLREVVLALAIVLFGWVAWRMISRFRRQFGSFYYWYGLGLGLTATGLIGVLLLTVQGGILGWTNRLTQYLGSAYLLIAAITAARETGTWTFSLRTWEESWRESWVLPGLGRQGPLGWVWRYGLAVAAAAATLGMRLLLERWVGPGFPPYILLLPSVMVVAILGGFGPGMVATTLGVAGVAYWILPPRGSFWIASPSDRLGLVLAIGMAMFFCSFSALYRRNRAKAAVYDREAATREIEARYRLLADHTEDFVSLHDAQGSSSYVSPSFFRATGWSREDLASGDWRAMIHPEDLPSVAEALAANLRGEITRNEYRFRRKDGRWLWLESICRPILGTDGSVERKILSSRDITQRKGAEKTLRETVEELQRSNRDLEQFAYVASHDLQEPLRQVRAFVQILQDRHADKLEGKAVQYMQFVSEGAERMSNLVQGLLLTFAFST